MSTENEGTEVPPAPSAPPVPVETPAASPQPPAPQGGAPTPPPPSTPPHVPGAPQQDGASAGQAPASEGPQPGTPGETGAPPAQPYASSGFQHPQHPQAPQGGPGGAPVDGSWPPPQPPAVPAYADGGAGAGTGGGAGWGATYQQPAPKPRGRRGGLIAAVLVAALVAGGLGGGLGYTLAKNDDGGSTTVAASDSGASQVKRDPNSIAGLAAKALPSTVTIEAESTNGQGGTGTGFVFDTQGHIVTNNHVVADAVDGGKLTATFPDGRKYDAEIVGHAQGYDVAVIKLKNAPSDLKPLALGDSDKVAVGDETIAIGAPFGLSNTVTTGIISAKNRPVASSDGSSDSKASYMSALQTDASINPGNSGGPLLDARGAVIGINSAIQSSGSGGGMGGSGQSGSIGLGFAIPVNQAKYVAQQLIKTGKPVYAKIGASVSLVEGASGAKITDQDVSGSAAVEAGGPADTAGLKPGDVITKLDDTVVDSGPTLIGEIWTHKPGDKVKITYKRDGKEHTTEVVLGSRVGDSSS
ncbi:trypsin-like peptidase domain-containing protein [Streptomyces sp. NPDC021356]|uniref:S1C family serine protease n=1 Tax=Streptomyces sp. NPDC021356 TaxID=3154900 RepID=UPI0033D86CC3